MNDNPSLNPLAAIKSPHDSRDLLFTDVAFGAAPFDWKIGYDYEEDLASIGLHILTRIKDQNGSGSCGGQVEGYGGASISAFHDGVYEEKSAKFTYAPVASPGGGSSGRDLSNRTIKFGWGSEALTSSYENGKPPSEAFMERAQDITPAALQHAVKDRALNYNLVPVNIDFVAQAIRDNKFVRLGVVGSNNGTWRTADPVPPTDHEEHWYHWIAGLKARMRNGKKAIGFPNSWGTAAGDQGWQWLSEDWFHAQLSNDPYGAIPIFEPRSYTWNSTPLPPVFQHTFNKDLQFGMNDLECIQLQTALRLDGEFPSGVPYNAHFGLVTLASVKKFQVKYSIAAPGSDGFGRFGPLSRAKMNSLFA